MKVPCLSPTWGPLPSAMRSAMPTSRTQSPLRTSSTSPSHMAMYMVYGTMTRTYPSGSGPSTGGRLPSRLACHNPRIKNGDGVFRIGTTIRSKREAASGGANALSCSVKQLCQFFEFLLSSYTLGIPSLISLAYFQNEIIVHISSLPARLGSSSYVG